MSITSGRRWKRGCKTNILIIELDSIIVLLRSQQDRLADDRRFGRHRPAARQTCSAQVSVGTADLLGTQVAVDGRYRPEVIIATLAA